jgi:hypothetical protein
MEAFAGKSLFPSLLLAKDSRWLEEIAARLQHVLPSAKPPAQPAHGFLD